MIEYEELNAAQAQQALPELCGLLQACVAFGASVGFTDAADGAAIKDFWQNRIQSLAGQEARLLVARAAGRVVGTVMVNGSAMPNGRHRAEISKLLVHPQARRQGIARRLMQQAEALAQAAGLSLLVLDTRSGDVAGDLYLSLGWRIAGSIPAYAQSTEGKLDATTLMYKILA
ncbi:GNAT family N-acetyltransferase [Pantoea sp.]|uniref:GNAT family N-acetyltransferase n=1 Tax=Pantoea sp. TaxID=69393 RepID=UPI00289C8127|nr:GNAT family N-acetyltransferase [Pantoea sp.]